MLEEENGGMSADVLRLVEDGDAALFNAMTALEELIAASGRKYLCGDAPTVADFLLGAQAADMMTHGQSWKAYPKASAWRHSMFLEVPGFL